jgi:cysteine-S-conjugate beta-lyase
MKLDTRLVHFPAAPDDPFRPVATPIYQTATFEQESALEFSRYDYSRSGNPTRTVLEDLLASLEGAHRAFCFASGLAAITAVARLLRPGDELVAGDDLYGGTCRLFSRILSRSGIVVRYTRGHRPEDFRREIGPRTRLVHIESPTNPLLKIVDIAAVAELAHQQGALLCVDNTLMSSYLQNPLAHGADVVVHSATKFLSGHSDVTAGVVAVTDPALAEEIYLVQNGEGATLGPFDSYLLLRGVKTLGLRVERQQSNAQRIAEFLSGHPLVRRLYWPGAAEGADRAAHAKQARGDGSVISFETGSVELSRRVVEATRIFAITVSFGSVNSSISLPARMSHASVPHPVAAEKYLPQDLVRLSVGIEDATDLVADLSNALERAAAAEKKKSQAAAGAASVTA